MSFLRIDLLVISSKELDREDKDYVACGSVACGSVGYDSVACGYVDRAMKEKKVNNQTH